MQQHLLPQSVAQESLVAWPLCGQQWFEFDCSGRQVELDFQKTFLTNCLQAIVFYSNKENKTKELGKCVRKPPANEKPVDDKDDVTRLPTCDYSISQNGGHIKPELAALEPSKPPNLDLVPTASSDQIEGDKTVDTPAAAEPEKIPLPQVNITPINSKKLITNLMKQPDPVVKYNNSQKCVFASCKTVLNDPKAMDYHIDCHLNNGFVCLECQVSFH